MKRETYADFLRSTVRGMATSWKQVPEFAGDTWCAFIDFAREAWFLLLAVVLPLLLPLAPLLAWAFKSNNDRIRTKLDAMHQED